MARVKQAWKNVRLQMAVKETADGSQVLFLKSGDGSYHAFQEVTCKTAISACGFNTHKKSTRTAAKQYLGF